MVIISTSAALVSSQAVSPLLRVGASAAKAHLPVIASMPSAAAAATPAFFKILRVMFVIPLLQRVAVGFAGADTHDLFERRDENLSVADLAGLRPGGDCVDHCFQHLAL